MNQNNNQWNSLYVEDNIQKKSILLKLLANLSSDRRVFSVKTRRPISVKTNNR